MADDDLSAIQDPELRELVRAFNEATTVAQKQAVVDQGKRSNNPHTRGFWRGLEIEWHATGKEEPHPHG